MLKEGYKQVQIAKAIEKNKSVVSRELKHNSDARISNTEVCKTSKIKAQA